MSAQYDYFANNHQNPNLTPFRALSAYTQDWEPDAYLADGNVARYNGDNTTHFVDMYRTPATARCNPWSCVPYPVAQPQYCPWDCVNRSPGYVPNPAPAVTPSTPAASCGAFHY